jgi:ABC-2 type transport system ATP-binding protein
MMIQVEQLTKDFHDFRAVDQVTLNVPAGHVLALLGPNGAGKTTTVRMMTSLLPPTAGSARIAGYDVVTQAEEVRASVGVLTEQQGLYERMKALEYLDFFGQMYDVTPELRRQRGLALMERFGLTFALNKRLSEYSKGMKQKLALVRAMLHDPPVLLLDEPTSAMDPYSAKQVRDAILDLKRGQRTFLITTHNLVEAHTLADRIAIIKRGKIIAEGTFDELVQKFVGDPMMEVRFTRPLNGLARDLDGLIVPEASGDDWLRYRTPSPETTNPALLAKLTALGVGVLTLAPVPLTLEDVYLQVVKDDLKPEDLR